MPLVMMVVLVEEVLRMESAMRGGLNASGHDGGVGRGST